MNTASIQKAGAASKAIRRWGALMGLLVVAAVGAPAQTSMEDRMAAMEALLERQNARIQQLEQELAVSQGEGKVQEVRAVRDDGRPFIRPAVLVSSTSGPILVPAAAPEPALTPEPAAAAVPAPPQDPTTSPDFEGLNFFRGMSLSGSVDAYYGYNFNKPGSRTSAFHSLDPHSNSMTLNLVELDLNKAVSDSSPLGYRLTFGYGPTADIVNGGDFGIGNVTGANFLQYYLSGQIPGSKLTIDVGKFVTQHGAEVIETAPNWNYSRGILFGFAIPFYHFGVRATYAASEQVSLAAFLVNGWNNVVDNNGGKTFGAQLIWTPSERFTFVQNYMVGPENADDNDNMRHLFDSLLTVGLHEKVTFMTNFDYGMDEITGGGKVHWIGAAGYLRLSPASWFAFTPRFEYYNDPNGFTTGARQQVKEITFTPEFLIGENFITRFEYRRDWSNAATFSRGPAESGFSQDTVGLGVILKF